MSEKISGKQNQKSVNPKDQDSPAAPVGTYSSECFPFRNGSLVSSLDHGNSDHRTFFNPSKVEQWVANSASGPDTFLQFASFDQAGGMSGSDPSLSGAVPEMPGSFSVSRSTVSHVSLQHSAQIAGANGSMMNYDDMCTANATSRIDPNLDLSPGLEFDGSVDFLGEQYHHDIWSYQAPVDDDSLFSNSAAVHTKGVNNEPGLCSEWPPAPFQAGDELLSAPIPCTSQSVAWSPLLVVDPSASSSYSQSSLLVPQPNTPLSPATQEETWCATQRGNSEEETGLYPQFSIGDAVHFPSPVYPDGNMSTLKPQRVFQQRAPLSNIDSWPQCEVSGQVYMASTFPNQRRSSEGETTTAREHPLYHVGPRDDGLYHCPFAGEEDCTHKPEKLKCNYDKHLDSHLKPYRCKVPSCVEVPFSSTACLLRHEREAHGMHGHGEKPHLCHFQECERSAPGNGFPRRWNLGDHMKRVHDYTGPASSTGSSSPTPSSASSFYQGIPSKRRTSNTSQSEAPKRVKAGPCPKPSSKASSKASKSIAPATSQGKQRQTMDKEWHEKKAAIKAGLECLDPNDAMASEQINADCEVLRTIGLRIRRHEAGQLGN